MTRTRLLLIAALAGLSLGTYLLVSARLYGPGFPLDDAWIHQTYARNLAQAGEWAFRPGQPSGGSTAPFWSILLSAGYLFGSPPLLWAGLLGWLLLTALGMTAYHGISVMAPGKPGWAMAGAVLILFEWHLVWAAGSGMETILFALMVTAFLIVLAARSRRWFWMGLLVGAAVWIRPDGITLAGPLAWVVFFHSRAWSERGRAWILSGLGFLSLFLPYLVFNLQVAGDPWPNTLYAKQAEYAVLQEIFIGTRFLNLLRLPLVGVGVLLLPGVLLFAARVWRTRHWGLLGGMIWWLGYLAIYAWRLPVTYQHGRYLIPVMPIFFLWGVAGMATWVQPASGSLLGRVLSRAWPISAILVAVLFWIQGGRVFSQDTAFINAEMVATAKWISMNTAADARIAAHDIGALGYFADRELLDLAGLVSPEVIPFIRDEARLRSFIDESGSAYFVTLRGWYPHLESGLEVVFVQENPITREMQGAPMVVYRWLPP